MLGRLVNTSGTFVPNNTVLTAAQLEAGNLPAVAHRVRSLRSLEQQYRAYVMQRIEGFKDTLSRAELMSLGDDAARELVDGDRQGQLVLTEMLMLETVDQQIVTKLKLPSFKKWRARILPLREAQRSPTRWGIEASEPVAHGLRAMEPDDHALVIGGGAERAMYLLAAHDLHVQCLVDDSATAGRIEGTLASEALSAQCEVFVVMLGLWAPSEIVGPFHFVVVDAAAVGYLPRDRQRALIHLAQQRTVPGGLHAVVSSDPDLAPETCLTLYQDWQRVGHPGGTSTAGQALRGQLLSPPPLLPSPLRSLP
ncbi:MAG: hypothetical protein FJ206_06400 [Gemmatimonadetes bacterium]|nr:hypothetical protein [Gemmatimonadota bacterium]